MKIYFIYRRHQRREESTKIY